MKIQKKNVVIFKMAMLNNLLQYVIHLCVQGSFGHKQILETIQFHVVQHIHSQFCFHLYPPVSVLG